MATWISHYVDLTPHAIIVLFAVFVALAVATFAGTKLGRRDAAGNASELELRIQSWWVMILLIVAALVLGQTTAIVFFAGISFLALKEYLSIIPTRRADRSILLLAYLAIPLQYWLITTQHYGIFIVFVPVYMFLILPAAMVVRGETDGFLEAAGTLHWGLMSTVYSLGHVAYLLVLPAPAPGVGIAEGASLVIALLLLTQGNDVAQYIWGKSFGHTPIIPKVSPNKTWEGFLGGLATTALLAGVLLPWLSPFHGWSAVAMGLVVGIAGFFGDVVESALKRDIGIKDSSTLIPGHGGILDRVDSLIFTAPLFFHLTRYFAYTHGVPG
jgi:phosphatidate cytidylyltransferase